MSDAFEHTNRMGDAYRLQSKPGRNGKPKYSFARKLSGDPVDRLPDGYEAREHPETGQVTLRKIKHGLILPDEKRLLEERIRQDTQGLLFIVDVEDRSLVVYTSDMDADVRIAMLREMVPMDTATARRMHADIISRARYQKTMQFTLTDPQKRLFNMDRWCFLGSIDDWYFIEGNQPLSVLAEKYARHLGEESFFDLV